MVQSRETYTVTIDVRRSKTDGLITSSAVYGLHNLPREVLDDLHLFTSTEYLEDVPEDEEVPQRGQQRPSEDAKTTFAQLMAKTLAVFPDAILSENSDGSIIIEPGFYEQAGTDVLAEYNPGE